MPNIKFAGMLDLRGDQVPPDPLAQQVSPGAAPLAGKRHVFVVYHSAICRDQVINEIEKVEKTEKSRDIPKSEKGATHMKVKHALEVRRVLDKIQSNCASLRLV